MQRDWWDAMVEHLSNNMKRADFNNTGTCELDDEYEKAAIIKINCMSREDFVRLLQEVST